MNVIWACDKELMINAYDSVRQCMQSCFSEEKTDCLFLYDCQFLPDIESCFYDLITEFSFDGFSIDVCRSMVAMHDVSFSIITVI